MSARTAVGKVRHAPCIRVLARRWRKWYALITRLAMKQSGHEKIAVEEFQQARQDVLESCEECSKKLGAHLAPYFSDIRDRVEPWLTPNLVVNADRKIRGDLLTHGRSVLHHLIPNHLPRSVILILVGCIMAGAIAGILAFVDWEVVWNSGRTKQIQYFVQGKIHALMQASLKTKVFIGSIVLLVFGTLALRSTRNY